MTPPRPVPGSPFLRPLNERIGEAVARARTAAGLSQAAVADQMRVRGAEWSPSTVSAIETGNQSLRVAEVPFLAAILGVPPVHFVQPEDAQREFEVSVYMAARQMDEFAEQLRSYAQAYAEAQRSESAQLDALAAEHPDLWAALDPELIAFIERVRRRSARDIIDSLEGKKQ